MWASLNMVFGGLPLSEAYILPGLDGGFAMIRMLRAGISKFTQQLTW